MSYWHEYNNESCEPTGRCCIAPETVPDCVWLYLGSVAIVTGAPNKRLVAMPHAGEKLVTVEEILR